MNKRKRSSEEEFEALVRSALDELPDEILIFRDTLVRDFGDDPKRLRTHVIQTVRHEVGHHFGFDEAGVRKLGL